MGRKNSEIKISTLVGADSEIKGDFETGGSARIDGSVQGNVMVSGMLILGAGGRINGNINAGAVMIGGEVIGNITASEKAELAETARVFGDITTKAIVIDEHAVFQGKCDMNQETPEGFSRSTSMRAIRAGRKSAKAVLAEALKEAEEAAKQDEVTESSDPSQAQSIAE